MVQYLAKRIGRSLLTLFIIVTLACWTRCRCRSAGSGKTPCTVTWA